MDVSEKGLLASSPGRSQLFTAYVESWEWPGDEARVYKVTRPCRSES